MYHFLVKLSGLYQEVKRIEQELFPWLSPVGALLLTSWLLGSFALVLLPPASQGINRGTFIFRGVTFAVFPFCRTP